MTTTAKPFVWPERDENGQFLPGNRWASQGGQARAKKLTAQRRREIAARGFQAIVDKRFGGDREAAKEWLVKKGQWANDQHYPPSFQVFEDPGSMPGGNNGQAPGGTVSQGSLRERSALHLLLKEYDSMKDQQAQPKTKDFELAFLDGPPQPVEKPEDCPGYGRELPSTWKCPDDCPLAKACWEALDGGE